jgi:hypothetical protein
MPHRYKFVFVFLAALMAACGSPAIPPPTPDANADWTTAINAVKALQPNDLPEHLMQTEAEVQDTDFDPNQYFTAFTHISVEPGYVLDYNYYYDNMGGFPMLFARLKENDPVQPGQALPYLEHVQTDGTAAGYYELATLDLMSSQFYLYWHAAGNDSVIVPDTPTLEEVITRAGKVGAPMDDATASAARALNVTPQIIFEGSTVTVKLITFSNFSGFSERTCIFNKAFPHTIAGTEPQSKIVVPYSWGIVF